MDGYRVDYLFANPLDLDTRCSWGHGWCLPVVFYGKWSTDVGSPDRPCVFQFDDGKVTLVFTSNANVAMARRRAARLER